MRGRRKNMEYSRASTHHQHTFDMNEYFSGQRFSVGGRDYDQEDREEMLAERAKTGEAQIDKLPGRGIKEILRAIYRQ
jgi:hypothetical protein